MLRIFMQMQIFSLISLFLINVIQFIIICLSSQQLQVQLQKYRNLDAISTA
jgi:hypothetical protein